jgi:hypothetical protein
VYAEEFLLESAVRKVEKRRADHADKFIALMKRENFVERKTVHSRL